MCGIIGYSGSKAIDPIELKILFLMAEDRGGHACGWGTKDEMYKEAVKADEFVTKAPFPKGTKEVIGHTRYATNGKKDKDKNAHPFVLETLTGTHNGSLSNFYKLRADENLIKEIDVDSELLYVMIQKYGLDDALPMFTGNMALAWIDDNGLNLYRKRKPLFFGFKKNCLYYGSKEEYLKAINCDYIEEVEEDKHYVYSEGVLINERELKSAPEKPYSKPTYGYSGVQTHRTFDLPTTYKYKDYNSKIVPPDDSVIIETGSRTIYGWLNVTETVLYVKTTYYSTFKSSTGTLWEFELDNQHHIDSIDKAFPHMFETLQIENYKTLDG